MILRRLMRVGGDSRSARICEEPIGWCSSWPQVRRRSSSTSSDQPVVLRRVVRREHRHLGAARVEGDGLTGGEQAADVARSYLEEKGLLDAYPGQPVLQRVVDVDRNGAGQYVFEEFVQPAYVAPVAEDVPAVFEPETEGTPASVDAVLREILETEVDNHLDTVDTWLQKAQVEATLAGAGICVLPHFLAAQEPRDRDGGRAQLAGHPHRIAGSCTAAQYRPQGVPDHDDIDHDGAGRARRVAAQQNGPCAGGRSSSRCPVRWNP